MCGVFIFSLHRLGAAGKSDKVQLLSHLLAAGRREPWAWNRCAVPAAPNPGMGDGGRRPREDEGLIANRASAIPPPPRGNYNCDGECLLKIDLAAKVV